MRAFVLSILVSILIAVAAVYTLNIWQRTVYKAFASAQSVRLADKEAGHNLVGRNW